MYAGRRRANGARSLVFAPKEAAPCGVAWAPGAALEGECIDGYCAATDRGCRDPIRQLTADRLQPAAECARPARRAPSGRIRAWSHLSADHRWRAAPDR